MNVDVFICTTSQEETVQTHCGCVRDVVLTGVCFTFSQSLLDRADK